MTEKFTTVPCLRKEIEFERIEDSNKYVARMIDTVLGRSVKLDETSFLVAMHLEETQPFDELAEKIHTLVGADKKTVLGILDFMNRFHFLETVETIDYLKAQKKDSLSEATIHFDPDMAFWCIGCGACCGFQNIGPVEDSVIANLETPTGKQFLKKYNITDKYSFQLQEQNTDKTLNVFNLANNYCVFLDNHGHCLIHNKVGYDKKPLICQLFPLKFTKAPDGIYIGYQLECRSYTAAKRSGQKIGREKLESEAVDLLKQYVKQHKLFTVTDPVPLDFYRTLSFSKYSDIEKEFIAFMRNIKSNRFIDFPIKTTEFFSEKLDSDKKGRTGIEHVELKQFLQQFTARINEAIEEAETQESKNINAGLDEVKKFATAIENSFLHASKIVDLTLDAEMKEFLIDYYCNWFFIKDALSFRNLYYGIAVLIFNSIIAMAQAFSKANASRRFLPCFQDFLDGFVVVNYFTRHKAMKHIFGEFAEQIVDIFFLQFSTFPEQFKEISLYDDKWRLFYF